MRVGVLVLDYRTNKFAKASADLIPRSVRTDELLRLLDIADVPADVELVPLFVALPAAGGHLPAATLDALLAALDRTLTEQMPLDAVLVISSGVMLLEEQSADLVLLEFLRQRYALRHLAVYFDHVASFPDEILTATPLVVGPHEWPGIDRGERLERLLRLLHRWLLGTVDPVARVIRLPVLLPIAVQRTDQAPLDLVPSLLRAFERKPGVLAATVFGGFPYADRAFATASLLVVTDGPSIDDDAARLLTEVTAVLRRIDPPLMTIEEVVHAVLGTDTRPHLVLDTGDAPEAGAPGEGTATLWAALDLGAHGTLISGIVDPEAAQHARAAGAGTTLELELGGKRDPRHGYPIPVRGTVRAVADDLPVRSPRFRELPVAAGPSAWFELEGRYGATVHAIVTSHPVPFADLRLPLLLGCDPKEASIVIVKAALDILASPARGYFASILPATTPGISSTDLAFFPFERIPRPIWPLDPNDLT